MKKILSKDGTAIAVDRIGRGPALVFVDGAMCYRASGPSQPIAAALAEHFTVFTYDRRGRGDSGDTSPYDVQREIDDLDAVITEAGGQAFVFGVSSGAALALEAANRGVPMTRLALYEAPFIRGRQPSSAAGRLRDPAERRHSSSGRRGEAVKMFMKVVGVPGDLHHVDAADAGLAEGHRRRAHAAVRLRDRRSVSAGPAAAGHPMERRDDADAGDGRRQEPGLDAQRDALAGSRGP